MWQKWWCCCIKVYHFGFWYKIGYNIVIYRYIRCISGDTVDVSVFWEVFLFWYNLSFCDLDSCAAFCITSEMIHIDTVVDTQDSLWVWWISANWCQTGFRTFRNGFATLQKDFSALRNEIVTVQKYFSALGNDFVSNRCIFSSFGNSIVSKQNNFSRLGNAFASVQNDFQRLENSLVTSQDDFSRLENSFVTSRRYFWALGSGFYILRKVSLSLLWMIVCWRWFFLFVGTVNNWL